MIMINTCFALSALFIIYAGNNWLTLLLAVSFFGIFYAAAWPMYAATAADFFPRQVTGSVLGFWTIFYGIGLILAPTLGGYIADVTGTFIWSFFMAAIAGGLGTFFFSRLKRSGEGEG